MIIGLLAYAAIALGVRGILPVWTIVVKILACKKNLILYVLCLAWGIAMAAAYAWRRTSPGYATRLNRQVKFVW